MPVDDELVAARPGLKGFVDRTVVLGIRPEDMEDASLVSGAPPDRLISSTVELREALGSDVVVHFGINAPQAMTDDAKELAADVGAEALEMVQKSAAVGRSTAVARLNPKTRVGKDDEIKLLVDTTRLHFFDPDTGAGIYDETATKGE